MAGAVGAVAADLVLVGHLAVEGVAGGLLREILEEGRVEDGDVRDVGEELTGDRDALEVGRVVQRAQRDELLDPCDDVVVDEGRAGEVLAALDDAVADGDDVGVLEGGPLLLEEAQDLGQAESVVRDGLLDDELLAVVLVRDDAGRVADLLDVAVGEVLTGVRVDEGVLDGGRARVDDEDGARGHEWPFVRVWSVGVDQAWAWTAVMATVLMMSSTRAPRDRSLTGLLRPWRTGPMATAPEERCTAL